MGMYAEINLAGFKKQLEAKKEQIEKAARPAAKAIADVYYEAVKRNAQAIGAQPSQWKLTGSLADSIYRVHSDKRSVDGRQIYEISWNRKKAPHGHLVEFGYMRKYEVFFDPKTGEWRALKSKPLEAPVQVAAQPFLRPALDLKDQAKEAGVARFKEVLSKPES